MYPGLTRLERIYLKAYKASDTTKLLSCDCSREAGIAVGQVNRGEVRLDVLILPVVRIIGKLFLQDLLYMVARWL